MKHASRTTVKFVGTLAGVALLLAGCGTAAKESAATSPGTPSAPAATAAAQGTVVTVTETEFSIALSQAQFRPGTYTFEVHNAGGGTHNLHITGPGVKDAKTPNIAPDGTASLTVTLQSGTYELTCAVAGHKDAGMDVTITVP